MSVRIVPAALTTVLFTSVLAPAPSWGAVLRVCREPTDSGCSATVALAVAAAADGDTIELPGRTYAEAVVIDGRTLTFAAIDPVPPFFIDPTDGTATAVFTIASSTVEFPAMNIATTRVRALEITAGSDVSVSTGFFSTSGVKDRGGIILVDSSSLSIYASWLGGGTANQGGLIYAHDAALSVLATELVDGTALLDGGAVYIGGTGVATLDGISGSVFADNTAVGGSGGGLCVGDGVMTVDLAGGEFYNNDAGGNGGGVAVWDADVTAAGVTLEDNVSSASGGGLYLGSGHLEFLTGQVRRNVAHEGGGVMLDNATGTFVGSTFTGNIAGIGGAVLAYESASLQRNLFCNNAADGGGAARISGSDTVGVTNNQFYGNVAGQTGGALYITTNGAGLSVVHNHFVGNSGALGSVLLLDVEETYTTELTDNLLASNTVAGEDIFDLEDLTVFSLTNGPVAYTTNLWFGNVPVSADPVASEELGGIRDEDPMLITWTPGTDCADDDHADESMLGWYWMHSPLRDHGTYGPDRDGSFADIGALGAWDATPYPWYDIDRDGSPQMFDCLEESVASPEDAVFYPGAPDDPYDGIDHDCGGGSDYDADGDGHDAPPWGLDCDDFDAEYHPGAPDERSDFDVDADGYDSVPWGLDCDDDNAAVNPAAFDNVPGVNVDCDEYVDVTRSLVPSSTCTHSSSLPATAWLSWSLVLLIGWRRRR